MQNPSRIVVKLESPLQKKAPSPNPSGGSETGLHILLLSVHGLIRGHDLELGRDADTGGQTLYVVELARALAEQQFAVLAGLPLPEQKRFLLMTLADTERLDEEIEDLLAAWRSGDTDALEDKLSAAYEEFPELYRPLAKDRNRAWVERLEELLEERDEYLVVVGALHLVGRHSVVDLLRQRGHAVTQQ
jgi:uncharacterized protein YbaP (TraB family)